MHDVTIDYESMNAVKGLDRNNHNIRGGHDHFTPQKMQSHPADNYFEAEFKKVKSQSAKKIPYQNQQEGWRDRSDSNQFQRSMQKTFTEDLLTHEGVNPHLSHLRGEPQGYKE